MKKALLILTIALVSFSFAGKKEAACDIKDKSCAVATANCGTCAMCDKQIMDCKKCEKTKHQGKEYCFDSKDCKKAFKKDAKAAVKAIDDKNAQEVFCPVMGKKMTVGSAYDKEVYEGKTVYFCCAACKPEFDKNPKKYIKKLEKLEKNAKKVEVKK